MKRHFRFIGLVFCAAVLTAALLACGGGGGGGTGDVPATVATLSDIQSAVTSSIASLVGNELPVSSASTSGAEVTLLGYALCMPSAPYAPPAAQATPPDNLYGCQNNVTLTLTPAADTITFTYTAPQVYVDLQTYSALTGTDAGYMLYTNVTATVTASLSTTPDGKKQIGSVISNSLSSGPLTLASQDSTINSLGSSIAMFYHSTLNNELGTIFADFTDKVILTLPPYKP